MTNMTGNATDIGEAREHTVPATGKKPRSSAAASKPAKPKAPKAPPGQLSFGEQFTVWREAVGLSQYEVAERAEDKQAYISHIETGRIAQPNPAKLAKFAPILQVPLLDLLIAAGYVTREQLGEMPVDPDLEALILAMRADPEFMAQIRKVGGDENRVLRDVVSAMKVPLTTFLRERRDPSE